MRTAADAIVAFTHDIEKLTGERPRAVIVPRHTHNLLMDEAKRVCNVATMSALLGVEPDRLTIDGVEVRIAEGE